MKGIARKKNFNYILDGSNRDDKKDLRFGSIAAHELGVRSPLAECSIGKSDIRIFSKRLGLSTWDKPPFACLASRFPYGDRIAKVDLERVNKAEEVLQKHGFKQVRVRMHGKMARIEVSPDNVRRFSDTRLRETITGALKRLGFSYVSLDLDGYRTGSMNEVLK